jgi:hypothetical protein
MVLGRVFSPILVLCLLSACDHGLVPPPAFRPGFGGRIAYKGNWPPADSIKLLAVVAFKHFPPTNIAAEVLSGEAVFDTALAKNVGFQDYAIYTEPARFEYVVVAQQFGPNIFSDWRVIGVYAEPGSIEPTPVVVTRDVFVSNVNITVDFDHLPPNPLGRSSWP